MTLHSPPSSGTTLPPISTFSQPLALAAASPPTPPTLPATLTTTVPGSKLEPTPPRSSTLIRPRPSTEESASQPAQLQQLSLPPSGAPVPSPPPPPSGGPYTSLPQDYPSSFWKTWHLYQKTHGQPTSTSQAGSPYGSPDNNPHRTQPDYATHLHHQDYPPIAPCRDSGVDTQDSLRKRSFNMTSEEILAEKRRRNAGASARFRDRRKKREQELQQKCSQLELQCQQLAEALEKYKPNHPALLALKEKSAASTDTTSHPTSVSPRSTHTLPVSPVSAMTSEKDQAESPSANNTAVANTLNERVSQLEWLMNQFRQEKEMDTQKLKALEHENSILKSLLTAPAKPTADAVEDKTSKLPSP